MNRQAVYSVLEIGNATLHCISHCIYSIYKHKQITNTCDNRYCRQASFVYLAQHIFIKLVLEIPNRS